MDGYWGMAMYSHNIWASKYIKQILTEMKADTDSNTVTVEDFNTPLSKWIYHPDKINK